MITPSTFAPPGEKWHVLRCEKKQLDKGCHEIHASQHSWSVTESVDIEARKKTEPHSLPPFPEAELSKASNRRAARAGEDQQ